MAQKIGKIRFNVGNRGREHRGKDRNFDLRALCSVVNSPEIQERVKNRDMVGYYGHWQRMKFGLIPPETAIVDGKTINIEPAIVTTYLRADADGNIEHETEFLDTAAGKIAERLHNSRTGGFSSAIHANPRGNLDVPTIFAGFDYVLEPNFTTNRGYAFDSVGMDEGTIFDFVIQDFNQNNAAMNVLYDSLQKDHLMAMQTLQQLQEDNEQLLSALAVGRTVLDGVDSACGPLLIAKSPTAAFAKNASMFKTAQLAYLDKLPDPQGDMVLDQVAHHYGINQ